MESNALVNKLQFFLKNGRFFLRNKLLQCFCVMDDIRLLKGLLQPLLVLYAKDG